MTSVVLVSDCDDPGDEIRCRYEREIDPSYATGDDASSVPDRGEVESVKEQVEVRELKPPLQRWHVT